MSSDSVARVARIAASTFISDSVPVTASTPFHKSRPVLQHHQNVGNISQTEVGFSQGSSVVSPLSSEDTISTRAISPAYSTSLVSPPWLSSSNDIPFFPYSTGPNRNDPSGRLGPLGATGLFLPVNKSQGSVVHHAEGRNNKLFTSMKDSSDSHREGAPKFASCSPKTSSVNNLSTPNTMSEKNPLKKCLLLTTPENGWAGYKYQCKYPGCEKKFAHRCKLSVHRRVHTGEKPFTCDVSGCGKKYKWRSSMVHHIKTHHRRKDDIKPFSVVLDKNKLSYMRRQAASKTRQNSVAAMFAVKQHQNREQKQKMLEKPHRQQEHKHNNHQHMPHSNDEPSPAFRAKIKIDDSTDPAAAGHNLNAGRVDNGTPGPTIQASKPLPGLTPASAPMEPLIIFSQSPPAVIGYHNVSTVGSLQEPFLLDATAPPDFSVSSTPANVGNFGCEEDFNPLEHIFVHQETEAAMSEPAVAQ